MLLNPKLNYFLYIMNKFKLLLPVLIFLYVQSMAVPTKIVIRAKAKDAKFIGSSVGGVLIVVKDAKTQQVLARGKTTGGTGDTDRIMKEPLTRGKTLSDENTAGYETTLDLNEPLLVTIEAYSPLNNALQNILVTKQIWLIPGVDITGDGIILEIPGFIVDLVSPLALQKYSAGSLAIKANVVMMCGCPITPGGLWNADNYQVKAVIKKEDQIIEDVDNDGFARVVLDGSLSIDPDGVIHPILFKQK